MKRIALLSLGLIAGTVVSARQVDQQTAAMVARNFMAAKTGDNQPSLQLLAQHTVNRPGETSVSTYYVFGLDQKQGFVVVAADDIVKPILAYSTQNEFQTGASTSPETGYWMQLYSDQIDFAIQHHLEASDQVRADWDRYAGKTMGNTAAKPTNEVLPMLTTTWNQGTYYNIYTPGTGATKTPVGCVATAMAQIMKYWDYPTTGSGTYTYNHTTYGAQTADFGATTYQWGVMSDNLTASSSQAAKNAVSLLGYHCAVSVRMDFDPAGSGSQVLAWTSNSRSAQNAFKNHFKYKTSIQGLYREDYTDADWNALLKQELDNGRPMLYAGFGNLGGHAFVFDGYDASSMFHINWGWGGMSNGYFTVDNLAPSALGIGGGGGDFNTNQQVLIGIEPSTTPDSLNLALANTLTVSVPAITQGEPFTVNGKVANLGVLNFGGQVTAGLFKNTDNSQAANAQILGNMQIVSITDTSLVFNATNTNNIPAGDYTIKLVYRQESKPTWKVLPDGTGFTNAVPFTVHAKPTGIAETALDRSFRVYPIPAGNVLNIDRKGYTGKVSAVELYNLQGRLVFSAEAGANALPVSQLASGAYYLRIVTADGATNKKIVVRH